MRLFKLLLPSLVIAGCVGDASTTTEDLSGPAPTPVLKGGLSGAVFTTTADGTRVNANIYAAKEDVYLDGGPRRPQDAALPEGDYVFEVTDPSGATLLSLDDASCRGFHVDANGRISAINGGSCAHASGNDTVRGGLTVQLMPYADTPNPGGEYKVHVTTAESFAASGEFVPRFTKTDNFKIRAENGGGSGEGSGGGSDEGGGGGSGSDSGGGGGSGSGSSCGG